MNGFELCEIPTILQIIYFIKLLINILKFIIPIGLIIIVMLDFSKSVINDSKKNRKIIINLQIILLNFNHHITDGFFISKKSFMLS